ncbi:2316_t:CDS:1, partial [Racocetra persica]
IGFTTPLLNAKNNQSITEVHCDAIYKTAKGRFELYGLIANFEGSGYPLAYLILDTT